MKNSFKFGFLGLALTFALASCGGQQTQTEEANENLSEGIENSTEHVADSLENVADSVRAEGDSISDSLQNVQ